MISLLQARTEKYKKSMQNFGMKFKIKLKH